jgi:hypothetical protein
MNIRNFLLFNIVFLLASCAFVNTEILDEANICLTPNSIYQIEIINRETVIGSQHTPFDYGNKSISDQVYTFQVLALKGEVESNKLKSWLNSKAIIARSGELKITNNKIYINLQFDGLKLNGKVLFSLDNIKQCASAL